MKKKFIILILLSFFILMMLPSASSLQFKTSAEARKSGLVEKTKNIMMLEDSSYPSFFGNAFSLLSIIGMVLITVIVAAIIYIYVSSMIGPPPH